MNSVSFGKETVTAKGTMNWDTQLNSILNETDSNVAKIKQRLNTTGYYAKVGSHDMVDTKNIRLYEPLSATMEHISCSDVFSQKLPKEELMSISRQLQFQGKTIESLHQALLRVQTEKEHQGQKIRLLEVYFTICYVEEIRRLHNQSEERILDFHLERRMENLQKEMSNEIYNLQEQIHSIDRKFGYGKLSFSSMIHEVRERKKDLCEEHEALRKEIDNLKQKIWRQEDELLKQISDTKELKQSQDKNSKLLRELMNKYQWLSHAQASTGLEFTQIRSNPSTGELPLWASKRSTVAGLQEQLRNIQLSINQTSTPLKLDARKQYRMKNEPKIEPLNEDSDSNLSCTFSLADISSDDDFSVLQNIDFKAPSRKDQRCSSILGTRAREREQKTNASDEDVSVDLEGSSDSPPELNLSDLS
ncbi:coiled-coil domain-containing protein 159-like [Narcine bancroftii]|uniref:coiled-coil domain-containing protein 159-like n=1 Tax=Narcine bancroftii TaxID=1343680 RepID=UPI0038315BB9